MRLHKFIANCGYTSRRRAELLIQAGRVQVNGKVRGQIDLPIDISKDEALAQAKTDANVSRHLEGKTIRREIFVPGRMINLVVG